MDILGYKEMILKSETPGSQQELFQNLYRALNKGRKWLGGETGPQEWQEAWKRFKKKDSYALKAFTDNIVIGWPFRGDSEGWLQFNRLLKFARMPSASKPFFVALGVPEAQSGLKTRF